MSKYYKLKTAEQSNDTFGPGIHRQQLFSWIDREKHGVIETVGDQWGYDESSTKTFGQKITLSIPRSETAVSDYFLEVEFDNTTTAPTFSEHPLFNMVESYDFKFGQFSSNSISGKALFDYLMGENEQEARDFIDEMAGGDGTGASGDTWTLAIPLVAPGQKGILNHNSIGNMTSNEALNIGEVSTDLQFNIKLAAASEFQTANAKSAANSIKLVYRSYAYSGNPPINNEAAGKGVIASIPGVSLTSITDTVDLSSAVNINANQVLEDGELYGLVLSCVASTDTANKDYDRGIELDELKMRVKNNDFYIHENSTRGKIMAYTSKGHENSYSIGGTKYHLYPIPMSVSSRPAWLTDVGANGVNLFNDGATFYINDSATGNHEVNITAVYKVHYDILESGRVVQVYHRQRHT